MLKATTVTSALAFAAALGLSTMSALPVAADVATPVATAISDATIERLMRVLDEASAKATGPLGGLILKGYAAWKQYDNGRRVGLVERDMKDLRRNVYAALADVAAVIQRLEAGETLTAAQWSEAATRLDNHLVRIASVERRVTKIEGKLKRHDKKIERIEESIYRKPCGPNRYWKTADKVCADKTLIEIVE